MSELTRMQSLELAALCHRSSAVIEVVNALRQYREAVRRLLHQRHGDGSVDGYAVFEFAGLISDIEEADHE